MAEDKTRQGEMKQRHGLTRTMTQARKKAGLTQGELAKLMCTDRSVVTRWETGQLHPTVTTLEKWAEVTGKRLRILMV
jgi:transcriptional regulator with XRE-family HTH domain